MTKDRILYLYNQYLNDQCTPSELEELKVLLSDPANESSFSEALDKSWNDLSTGHLTDMKAESSEAIFREIVSHSRKRMSLRSLLAPLAAAAAVLIVTSFCLLIFFADKKNTGTRKYVVSKEKQDIAPGTNKAVLTLANGQSIALNSLKSGILSRGKKLVYSDGSSILQTDPGAKAASATHDEPAIQSLVLSTPKGGQYQIVLSDGTKVWLNSDSKLKYPGTFDQATREVELEGEAYFEVAKDKEHPFIVRSDGQQVEVLGTHFNISAYGDETSVKTTLLEGSVKISRERSAASGGRRESLILKPGQQSEIAQGGTGIRVSYVNTDEATDWKDGLFLFNDEPVKMIMRRISRWYNVDVVYEGNLDKIRFVGSYSRSKGLTNLLKNIELTGKVRFRTEEPHNGKERRIIVTANY